MNIQAIRLKNLLALREACDGSVARLAEKIDTDPNYISQIVGQNGTRSVGHRFARKCEKAFKKPDGWMDRLHDPIVEEFEDVMASAPQMTPAQREAIRAHVSAVKGIIKSFTVENAMTSSQ